MIAITTKYIPPSPSGKFGGRIKATVKAGNGTKSVTVSFHAYDKPEDVAAAMLIRKMGWVDYGTWYKGHVDENTQVYLCSPDRMSAFFNVKAFVGSEL